MQEYIENIAEKLLGYEPLKCIFKESDSIDTKKEKLRDHVLEWASQFKEAERKDILRISDYILDKYYINEEMEIDFLRSIFDVEGFVHNKTVPHFLNIQKQGNSQKRLVQRIGEIVTGKNLAYRDNCYVYLDDFIFTGGRVSQDILPWLDSLEKSTNLTIITIGWYTSGKYQLDCKIEEKIKKLAQQKGVILEYNYIYMTDSWILENRKFYRNNSENIWPIETTFNFIDLQNRKIENFPYRVIYRQQKVFKNQNDRDFFERICLKYGYDILDKCRTIGPKTKPLGNHFFDYGFGGLVFNYRNCPNNVPLIFWHGSNQNNHPLRHQWYPLMPRHTYSS